MKFYPAILAFIAIPAAFAQMAMAPPAPTPPAAPEDPNKVILTIGTEKLTEGQFEDMINALPAQYQAFARGAGKRQFADQVVQIRVLSQEAEKRKLDQTPKVQEQLKFQRQNLLAGAMFQALQDDAKVDDAAVQKYYDDHKMDYETVKARHILIRVAGAPMPAPPGKPEYTDEQALAKAQEIKKQLAGGADFAKLAESESYDTGSASQGGDLGEFKKGMMVPPFEEAAFAARIGQVTDPVKTPFGYHLIKVEEHTTKTLADVKADILGKLRPDAAKAALETLSKGTPVKLDDAYFGPAAPAAPAAPTAVK